MKHKQRFILKVLLFIFILSSTILDSYSFSASAKELSNENNAVTAEEAKQLLIKGNERFIEGTPANKDISEGRRKELSVNGQKPFAIIVSCSDSRVPPELVFDQALGDIFVIRNAGNVSDPVMLGSVEYGAEYLKAPLIVVLGHEKCGAIKAAVDGEKVPGSINIIVDKIRSICGENKNANTDKINIYEKCADENIKNTVAEIKKSPVIKKLEKDNKVTVIGAKYQIETGKVVFQ